MTARKQNIILKSLLQQETDSRGSSLPRLPSKVVKKPRQANSAWCIIGADGATSIIGCKSELSAPESKGYDLANAQGSAKSLEDRNDDVSDTPETGVDLSYLNVERETACKLIAGMNAMIEDEPAGSLQREIAIPSAKTDLHEIFKTDRVCMINPPRAEKQRV